MPSTEDGVPMSQPMRLRFYTQNEDGSIPRRGAILSDDCEYRLPLSKTGEVELFLRQECEFYAVRYDGLFRLYSDPVVVPYIESGSIEQEFFFPIARTGGFGIRIDEAEEGIHVLYVYPSGPAAEQDIGVGDIIIEIDGMPAKEMTIEEFIEYGTGPEGTAVSFRLLRDSDEEQPRTIIRRSLQN
ncbi:MAG: PDZ domain-containing protein [Myxococcota bacterium]|nr:PDZ domain-containing protein [Myxococcota bacterium]